MLLETHPYVANRLGVFYHFSLATFTGIEWSPPEEPPASFAPEPVDCSQWLDAAVRMEARYAILTSKHHDGFCLWPSKLTGRTVAHATTTTDIVGSFVKACRSRNILPGLYFSIWDTAHGPSVYEPKAHRMPWNAEREAFVFGQLEELLTGYGPLHCLWLDGCWGGMTLHKGEDVALLGRRIRAHIKSIQPNCYVLFNWHRNTIENGMADLRATEIQCGLPCADNIMPHEVCSKGTTSHWFWEPDDQALDPDMLVYSRIFPTLSANGCHLLNLAPDRSGQLPQHALDMADALGQRMRRYRKLERYERMHIRKPQWTFSAHWNLIHDQHGSAAFSTHLEAEACVPFRGTSMRLIGQRFGDNGMLELELDGTILISNLHPKTDLNLHLPRQILYERHDLPPGEHLLRVRLRRQEANPQASIRLALEALECD